MPGYARFRRIAKGFLHEPLASSRDDARMHSAMPELSLLSRRPIPLPLRCAVFRATEPRLTPGNSKYRLTVSDDLTLTRWAPSPIPPAGRSSNVWPSGRAPSASSRTGCRSPGRPSRSTSRCSRTPGWSSTERTAPGGSMRSTRPGSRGYGRISTSSGADPWPPSRRLPNTDPRRSHDEAGRPRPDDVGHPSDHRRGADRAGLRRVHQRHRHVVAAEPSHPAGRTEGDGVRAVRRRAHHRPRSRRERVPVGTRADV